MTIGLFASATLAAVTSRTSPLLVAGIVSTVVLVGLMLVLSSGAPSYLVVQLGIAAAVAMVVLLLSPGVRARNIRE